MRPLELVATVSLGTLLMTTNVFGEDLKLQLRSQQQKPIEGKSLNPVIREARWSAKETAVIVCDVWDAHHCLNAVRRLEEFAPRMNEVLKEARRRGATIIHSPSDCMAAYEDHAARKRAVAVPAAKVKPKDIEHWCSRIPSEEQAVYPIDQSDGGEDDDPAEHAAWAAKLAGMGRNPGMPWKTQSKLIEIDADRDFITDRGDEVWNVLESRAIKNVILVGVHLNMCVLGRPFGLRQMVRNGKNVALMRDMTDCMYNPKRWPHVDHFTGNDLVIAHVARFVCPTITSDQILGGEAFRSKYDNRTGGLTTVAARDPKSDWTPIEIPSQWSKVTGGRPEGVTWYRCVVRLPKEWLHGDRLILTWSYPEEAQVWVNGERMWKDVGASKQAWLIPRSAIVEDDFNFLVFREPKAGRDQTLDAPKLVREGGHITLQGRWQFRIGDDKSWSNIPLPAKFGGSTDMLFEPAR